MVTLNILSGHQDLKVQLDLRGIQEQQAPQATKEQQEIQALLVMGFATGLDGDFSIMVGT